MNRNLFRLALLVMTCLGLLALTACPQGSDGEGTTSTTTTGSTATGSSAGADASAKSGGLTYTAVLTYRSVPERGKAEDVELVLCEGYPLTKEAEGRPNNIYYAIKYYETMKAWTGTVNNQPSGELMSTQDMQNVLMTITLSDGREYTWRPHDGDLRFGSGEGINIPAPELLGK